MYATTNNTINYTYSYYIVSKLYYSNFKIIKLSNTFVPYLSVLSIYIYLNLYMRYMSLSPQQFNILLDTTLINHRISQIPFLRNILENIVAIQLYNLCRIYF